MTRESFILNPILSEIISKIIIHPNKIDQILFYNITILRIRFIGLITISHHHFSYSKIFACEILAILIIKRIIDFRKIFSKTLFNVFLIKLNRTNFNKTILELLSNNLKELYKFRFVFFWRKDRFMEFKFFLRNVKIINFFAELNYYFL